MHAVQYLFINMADGDLLVNISGAALSLLLYENVRNAGDQVSYFIFVPSRIYIFVLVAALIIRDFFNLLTSDALNLFRLSMVLIVQ